MMMISTNIIILIVFILLSNINGDTIIETTNGFIQGTTYTSSNGIPINSFKGIPFAQPPERWRSPLKALNWTGILDATKQREQCVQSGGSGVEDCLYLNVHTLANATSKGPLPVLFYIYGGSLMNGNTGEDFTNFIASSSINGEGIVVVQAAYRLNIFGFLATKELSHEQHGTSGNYGIEDQLLALTWVQDNIEKFGGDKNRVTIAGQSSGGTSVFALMSSPKSSGLFHRAFSMSGSTNLTISMKQAEEQNENIIKNSGCDKGHDTAATLDCLRAAPVAALVSLIPVGWGTPGIWGLPKSQQGQGYSGLPVVDGKIITDPFDIALAKGIIDVPIIFGNMGQECDSGPDKNVESYSSSEWESLINDTFSNWNDASSISSNMLKLYSSNDPQKNFDEIVTDYGLTCSSFAIGKKLLKSNRKSNTYVYINNWSLQNTVLRNDYEIKYAYHYLDFAMILEYWNDYAEYIPQQQDLDGSKFLQSIWYEFMSTGTVNPSLNWIPINSDSSLPIFVIEPYNSRSSNTYKKDVCDYYHSIGLDSKTFWWVN